MVRNRQNVVRKSLTFKTANNLQDICIENEARQKTRRWKFSLENCAKVFLKGKIGAIDTVQFKERDYCT